MGRFPRIAPTLAATTLASRTFPARTIEGDYWAIQCKCYEKAPSSIKPWSIPSSPPPDGSSRRRYPTRPPFPPVAFWVSTSDVFGRNPASPPPTVHPFLLHRLWRPCQPAVDYRSCGTGSTAQAALPCRQRWRSDHSRTRRWTIRPARHWQAHHSRHRARPTPH